MRVEGVNIENKYAEMETVNEKMRCELISKGYKNKYRKVGNIYANERMKFFFFLPFPFRESGF